MRGPTVSGRVLGVIREVVPNPANDLWVAVDADGRETLVPALADLPDRRGRGGAEDRRRGRPGLTAPEPEG